MLDTSRARRLALALLAWLPLVTGAARAQDPAPTRPDSAAPAAGGEPATASTPEPSLQEQIDQLRQQLLVLERKAQLAAEAEAEKAKSGSAVVASGKDGFALRSNDGDFVLRLRGYMQVDGRAFVDDPQHRLSDNVLLRRLRPIFEGSFYRKVNFRLMPDFGGGTTVVQDAYVEYVWRPEIGLRAGKTKAPLDLERLQSATDTAFLERAFPTSLSPLRDTGVQLAGTLGGGRLEYAVGLFDGAFDGGSTDTDTDDRKDLDARLWATPWAGTSGALSGLSFGIGAGHGSALGTLSRPGLPIYRTPGIQTFFAYRNDGTVAGTVVADGTRERLVPQAAYYDGPFGLLAEWARSSQEVRRGAERAKLEQQAWQVTGIWVITGQDVSLRWYEPRPGEGERAPASGFALTARVHALSTDAAAFPTFASATSTQQAKAWAVGVDWTVQRFFRLMLEYENTRFAGRSAARPTEKLIASRVQVRF